MNKRFLTQVEQNQKEVDELVELLKKMKNTNSCNICQKMHSEKNTKNTILCKHKQSYVHIDCCSTKCSWHGEPCINAVFLHE